MPENRQYAGPHDAAELAVDDGRYALVVRRDISDEVAANLGYTFDADEAMRSGRAVAARTITVSDELAAKLDRAAYVDPDTGDEVPSWPKAGGKAAAQTVDVPESNPSTMPVTVDDGSADGLVLTSAEADERAYTSAAAEDALEAQRIAEAEAAAAADEQAQRDRLGAVDERLAELKLALDAGDELDAGDRQALVDERGALESERAHIEKALGAGEGR